MENLEFTTEEFENLQQENSSLKEALGTKEQTIEDLQSQFELLKSECEEWQTNYSTTHTLYTDSQTEKEGLVQKIEELENQYNDLETNFQTLQTDYQALKAECDQKEDAEKDALIDSFSFLEEDELNAIKGKKADYSLEDLEEKLSAISFKKGFSFKLMGENKQSVVTPVVTHQLPDEKPEWLSAVDSNKI